MAEVVIQPNPQVQSEAWVKSMEEYKTMYDRSLKDPEVDGLSLRRKNPLLRCSTLGFPESHLPTPPAVPAMPAISHPSLGTALQGFWGDMAKQFHWNKSWESPFSRYNIDLNKGDVKIEWFLGAETNVVSGGQPCSPVCSPALGMQPPGSSVG
jgi:hypothetical protein